MVRIYSTIRTGKKYGFPKQIGGGRQNGNLGGTHQENGRAAVEEKRPVNEVNLCFGGSNVFHYNRWRFKECRFE